jgi:uncharacterized membrane protein HdeD (DUF308 family)
VGLRGLLSIVFGLLALIWPEIAVEALVLLFGAYVLVDGVFAIISAIAGRQEHRQWWLVLVEGIAGIAFGVITIGWPSITALVLLLLIAGWAIVTGILEIVAAILLRKELRGEWLLILGGILSVALGVLLAIQPRAGVIVLAWLIGVYAILFGVLLIVLAFRLRGWTKQIQRIVRQV